MANNGPFYEQGVYRVEITDQALGESNTGTPQFALRFLVRDKIEHDGDVSVTEYERTTYLYLSEKAIEASIKRLKALGFAGTSFRHLDPQNTGYHNFTGTVTEMVCNHETYEGKLREKWSVRVSGESKPLDVKPIDSKKLRDLDNLFGRQLKEAAKDAPAGTTRAAAPTLQEGVTDDDIPF